MRTIKNIAAILLAFIAAFAALPSLPAGAGGSVVAIKAECPGGARVGGTACVRLTVGAPAQPLAAIEFTLSYDPELVSPQIKDGFGTETPQFIKKLPQGWEQLCSLDEKEGIYTLRFAAPQDGKPALDSGSQIVLEIPFLFKKAGGAAFVCDSADIVAVPVSDPLGVLGGSGAEITVAVSSETEKVFAALSGADEAVSGGKYSLQITFTNLAEGTGIIAAEFVLKYDKSCFSPVIKSNAGSEMDVFLAEADRASWEQMCTPDPAASRIVMRFAALSLGDDKTQVIPEGGSMVFTVEFEVTGSEGATPAFEIPSEGLIGLNCAMGEVSGGGSKKPVAVKGGGQTPYVPPVYTFADGYILGVRENTRVSAFVSDIGAQSVCGADGAEITEGVVCTGYKAFADGAEYTVIVRGDANGNGKIDAADYAMAKRTYLNTFDASEAQKRAICIRGGTKPSAADYAMIKRHYLRTFDLNTVE
ncbi:MAG: dockerin type I repeat-containing protein [Clostridia bacterium]|nr:dockerin type I repeat-containing protein [Clostridia bacterium]